MKKYAADFDSFCSRMWLDYEDENLTIPASINRMTRDEYVDKWHDWLMEKYEERNGRVSNN